ncbi:MAG: hypothetical protein ACTIME_02865 [Cellulosimicrobium funkei]|uniref:Uncharacterized protein n=1 Tax=Cellulosimicrobium cellulans TaxID=1710 RepID=A0ABX5XDN7_CELCE|nr:MULTISPECIES: hypothetical protein [Cellulosimicrobium]QDP74252.1 hypothetical protein FOG94_02975 [Cellulosimicrobium cellulans]
MPVYIAFIFGVDANRDTCVDAFGEPCRTAPKFFGVMVALLAAPPLLGLAIARPRETRAWVVATVGAALALFVVLLVTT